MSIKDPIERIARIEARIQHWKIANEEQYQQTLERLDSLQALLREEIEHDRSSNNEDRSK